MSLTSFKAALGRILQFRDERDWKQFHTPKDLAIALSVETSEILELFLWKDSKEIQNLLQRDDFKCRVNEELGDVLIYSLILCHEMGIDPGNAIDEKLQKNRERYPVNLAKGNAKKYKEFDS